MKKRSLVASIAMLLVSAIVLSTSTYAWFSAGAKVSVTDITASIQQSDGTIEISADGTTWDESVGLDQLKLVSTNQLMGIEATDTDATCKKITKLTPISGHKNTAGTMSFVSASLVRENGENTIKSSADLTSAQRESYYVYYEFKIRAKSDTTVTITPKLDSTYADKFVIGAVKVGASDPVIYAPAEGLDYYPLRTTTVSGTDGIKDTNDNYVLDAGFGSITGDTGVTASDETTTAPLYAKITPSVSETAISNVSLTANTPVTIAVWIWAEGQNTNCSEGVTSSGAVMSFTIEK